MKVFLCFDWWDFTILFQKARSENLDCFELISNMKCMSQKHNQVLLNKVTQKLDKGWLISSKSSIA
jgi:hypothetical protein